MIRLAQPQDRTRIESFLTDHIEGSMFLLSNLRDHGMTGSDHAKSTTFWLAEQGGMSAPEMLKTFNCGIGMIVVVAPDQAETLTGVLTGAGETVTRIGHVTGPGGVRYAGTLM